eukprot:Skav220839  [mRNA]  locus=scaffold1888:220612:220854:- [translate_table: standard]
MDDVVRPRTEASGPRLKRSGTWAAERPAVPKLQLPGKGKAGGSRPQAGAGRGGGAPADGNGLGMTWAPHPEPPNSAKHQF